jgi:hypothetical protein
MGVFSKGTSMTLFCATALGALIANADPGRSRRAD